MHIFNYGLIMNDLLSQIRLELSVNIFSLEILKICLMTFGVENNEF